jgi:hypothetical protein
LDSFTIRGFVDWIYRLISVPLLHTRFSWLLVLGSFVSVCSLVGSVTLVVPPCGLVQFTILRLVYWIPFWFCGSLFFGLVYTVTVGFGLPVPLVCCSDAVGLWLVLGYVGLIGFVVGCCSVDLLRSLPLRCC